MAPNTAESAVPHPTTSISVPILRETKTVTAPPEPVSKPKPFAPIIIEVPKPPQFNEPAPIISIPTPAAPVVETNAFPSKSIAKTKADILPIPDVRGSYRAAAAPVTKPVKHPVAYYFNAKGDPVEIPYTDLQDDNKFLYARNQDLFADVNKEQRLQVRNGRSRDNGTEYGIPHFWSPQRSEITSLGFKVDPTKETQEVDPRHEYRIDHIIQAVKKAFPVRIITYDFKTFNRKILLGEISAEASPSDLTDVDQFVLANVTGYSWERRTTKLKLAEDVSVIPDAMGLIKGAKATEEKPAIFIEVVNTSFPSEKKWQAYRHATSTKPLIVVFDFLEPYHFQPRKADADKGRSHGDIRVIYYMWKGGVWKNTTQLDARSKKYPVRIFKSKIEKDRRRRANAPESNLS